MKTVILTFKGGDPYNKQKQINSILKENKNAEWKDIDLEELDESIPQDGKTIILREEGDYIQFEKIIKKELPNLKEQIEVIPELFYRLAETTTITEPPMSEGLIFLSTGQILQKTEQNPNGNDWRILFPFSFPLTNMENPLKNNKMPYKGFLLIMDIENGFWISHPSLIFNNYPGWAEIIKTSGEITPVPKSIQQINSDLLIMRENAHAKNYISTVIGYGQQMKENYTLGMNILKEVEAKTVQLNIEKIKKNTEKNPNLISIIGGIMANLKQSPKFNPANIASSKQLKDMNDETANFMKAFGIDKDFKTGAEQLNKGGFALINDTAKYLIDKHKQKQEEDRLTEKEGNTAQAFLSHPDCGKFLKALLNIVIDDVKDKEPTENKQKTTTQNNQSTTETQGDK